MLVIGDIFDIPSAPSFFVGGGGGDYGYCGQPKKKRLMSVKM